MKKSIIELFSHIWNFIIESFRLLSEGKTNWLTEGLFLLFIGGILTIIFIKPIKIFLRFIYNTIKKLFFIKKIQKGIKLVIFDFDGTLACGYRYIWDLIYPFKKYNKDKREESMTLFRTSSQTFEDYKELCKRDEDALRSVNLKEMDFIELIKKGTYDYTNKFCRPTLVKNLKKGIKLLRDKHIKTAIVSGGINTFIRELWYNTYNDDIHKYFDDIFYNEFIYHSKSKKLKEIIPTKYDFSGKTEAIETLAKKYKLPLKNVVFIGDDPINDVIRGIKNKGLQIVRFSEKPHSDVIARQHYDKEIISSDFSDLLYKVFNLEIS